MALAVDWSGVADTDLLFSDFFGTDHSLVVRFLPQYAYTGDGPLLGTTGTDVFELGLGSYPGVNGVRVAQPYLRLAVGGGDILLESAAAMAPARTLADFDSGSYGSWSATGNCFGSAPAPGTLPNQNPVSGFFGRGLVNTFLNGDATTGTLTSPSLTLVRPFIRFLIGGGRHPKRCCLNLVVNGTVVRTETGQNIEQLVWRCWDVRELVGGTARLQIVDLEVGSWGHVLVDQIEFADSPLVQPSVWQELALVRTSGAIWSDPIYIPYLNGEKLGPPLALARNWTPSGRLRIGGRGRPGVLPGQFYGLIDEAAVYSRGLTQQELRERAWSPARMTGTETGLLAGWTFQTSAPPNAKLQRPLTVTGAASIVDIAPGHNSGLDAAKLPTHERVVRARLPLPVGEEWVVVQEFDERLGTHSGYASFCWDFARASGTTVGASAFATAAGEVVTVSQGDPRDADNLVEVLVAPEEIHTHLHLKANASTLTPGSRIAVGDKVSEIGSLSHLHFACSNVRHSQAGFTTRPMGFAFYERRRAGGSWNGVEFGMPRNEERLRRGWWTLRNSQTFPRAYVTAAARAQTNIDIFVARQDGSVHTAGWDTGRGWRGWWAIGDAGAVPGAPVHEVSRSADKLDVFITDAAGAIKTAAWEPGFTAWGGWWPIAGGRAAAGSPVTAVVRGPDKLDVFVVGTDNHVYSAAWEPGRGGWRGWWGIGSGRAPFRSPVHAVSRSQDKIDLFMTDENGVTMTAAWEPAFGWRGWWDIGGRATPGAPVTAVSRSTDKLDVFVVGNDNRVYTAAWEPSGGGWRGWWAIGDVRAPAAAPVHAVSRSTDKLDLFVTDVDGIVRAAAWAPATGWRGWWEVPGKDVVPGGSVYPVRRSPDRLDVFATGSGFRVATTGWQPGATAWQPWTEILP